MREADLGGPRVLMAEQSCPGMETLLGQGRWPDGKEARAIQDAQLLHPSPGIPLLVDEVMESTSRKRSSVFGDTEELGLPEAQIRSACGGGW